MRKKQAATRVPPSTMPNNNRKTKQRKALKKRNRRARENVEERTRRQQNDNDKHHESRENEEHGKRNERLERNRDRMNTRNAREHEQVVSPGLDATVDQFCDHVEKHGANSFPDSDQNLAAGAGVLYANNGTHLYGQNLSYQLPSPPPPKLKLVLRATLPAMCSMARKRKRLPTSSEKHTT
jgi:hypothetical protein